MSSEGSSPYIGGYSECPLISDNYERLCCELEELKRSGEIAVKATSSHGAFKAHHWTIIKLLFLKMYVRDVYTPIIGKRYFMVFIDLFAGTGLNCYENTQFCVPGSTLVAWFYATYSFDRIYAVGYDKSESRWEPPPYVWLERRVKRFIPQKRCHILKGDANKRVDDIVNSLINMKKHGGDRRGIHYLAFIDPTSHEVHWTTIEKLVNLEKEGIYGDFIILFQSRLLAREIGKVQSNPQKYNNLANELDKFFGTDSWRSIKKPIEKSIFELYLERLKKIKSRALIETIEVELMREDIHYYLIYITRKTQRGSPYLNTVRWLKDFVERVDQKNIVDNAIRKVLGLNRPLTKYRS